jgi:ribose 5-phosphate isomerase B
MARILVACDHRGVGLREKIVDWLTKEGYEAVDIGPQSKEMVDYPVYAIPLAERVVKSNGEEMGILICGWGNGMAIAANKVKGARAAICMLETQARYARTHNDANILVLSAEASGWGLIVEIMKSFLSEKFEGGRHERRIQMISKYDEERDT